MIANLPPLLLNAAREPFAAQAVIFALLLSRTTRPCEPGNCSMLQSQVEQPLYRRRSSLPAAIQSLPPTARLPLVDLAMPAIKRSSPQQYATVPPGRQRAGQRRRQGRSVRVLPAHDAVQLPGRSLRAEEAAGSSLSDG